jgi:hypothetical protein
VVTVSSLTSPVAIHFEAHNRSRERKNAREELKAREKREITESDGLRKETVLREPHDGARRNSAYDI